MLPLGWMVAGVSGLRILSLTTADYWKGWLSRRRFAEFLCTGSRLISPLDRWIPERLRLSSAAEKIGADLYWISQLKARNEWERKHNSAVFETCVLVFCSVLVAFGRVGVAAFVTLLLIAGVIALSKLKFKYVRMNLHAYDFIYFVKASNLKFFWKNYRGLAVGILTGLGLGIVALWLLVLFEPRDVNIYISGVLLVVALVSSIVISSPRPDQKFGSYWEWFDEPVNLENFFGSVVDSVHAWRRGGVLAHVPPAQGFPELSISAPKLERRPPEIILILNESTFPPWLYRPSLLADRTLTEFFRSANGHLHGLRVETFGGASWKSEFSALTGIPSGCYGAFGAHVFHWAAHKIHTSLPLRLKKFDYRTGMIFPLAENFIDASKFYRSVGIDEVLDMSAIGATCDREPDAFYLNAALNWFSGCPTSRPAFLYMSTMSNHFPHHVRAKGEDGTRMTANITDTEFDEYLRRLDETRAAYAHFRTELARRYPDREFLIVHFGDHQPPLTLQLLDKKNQPKEVLPKGRDAELLYQTYFAIDAVNFSPVIDERLPDMIETSYLGTVLLEAAGIPSDGLHGLRRELMMKYDGKLFLAEGDLAAQLNHRMLAAGMVTPH